MPFNNFSPFQGMWGQPMPAGLRPQFNLSPFAAQFQQAYRFNAMNALGLARSLRMGGSMPSVYTAMSTRNSPITMQMNPFMQPRG